MTLSKSLRIVAAVVLLLGLAYLYFELEAVRIGAISPFGYLGRIVLLVVVVFALMKLAKRSAASRTTTDEIKKIF